MDTRISNLRKLQLQLLFGPGIISCVGPPASGKTSTLMRMLCDHCGGASAVLGPNTSAGSEKRSSGASSSTSPSSSLIDAAVNAAMMSSASASGSGMQIGASAAATAAAVASSSASRRRKRSDAAAVSAADVAAATPPIQHASVVAYVSAASANSAAAAVRRLGREARRSARVWLDSKGTTSSGGGGGNNIRAATGYTAAETRSLDGAVAAASVDIRAAYEELQAAVAARNRAAAAVAVSIATAEAKKKKTKNLKNKSASKSAKQQFSFGFDDDDDDEGAVDGNSDGDENGAPQLLPQFLPPVLHLVLDDIDLLQIKEKNPNSGNNFNSGGEKHLKLGIGLSGYDDASPATTSTESVDGVLQALYRNISLSNVSSRGKRWQKPTEQSAAVAGVSTDMFGAPLFLFMEDSGVNVPVSTSAGIYIWCVSQSPFEARTLAERTVYFSMPTSSETALEAARIAYATLMRQASAAQQAISAADKDSSSKNQKVQQQQQQQQQQQHYSLEQLEKACHYFCITAPSAHSMTVRDCRLLAARMVAIVQKIIAEDPKTKPASGGAAGGGAAQQQQQQLPRLTNEKLLTYWRTAVQSDDQQVVARRQAQEQQDQMMMMAAAGMSKTDAGNMAAALGQATTAGMQGAAAASGLTGPSSSSSASSLVSSMRCLPVSAQLLAIACFCCGALSDAQLRAVLSDTAGAVKQVRKTAEGRSNQQPLAGAKFIFTMDSVVWVYDAVLKVATAIQSRNNSGGSSKQDNSISCFFGDDNGGGGGDGGGGDDKGGVALGSVCWTPGDLSSCLPAGASAVHHLLALEALGAIAPSRAAATVKYRCALLPSDASALASNFGLDLWQLTTSTAIRAA